MAAAQRLAENTLLRNPQTGQLEILLAGNPVPAWAKPLVGNHLLDKGDTKADAES